MGKFDTNTHFAYPNSNITPLGQVKVATNKSSILIPPFIAYDDVKELINKGLAQKPGADLIINYKVDTTVTSYLGLFIRWRLHWKELLLRWRLESKS